MPRNGLLRYIHMSEPNVTRVQSATEWTASVHTLHMSKPNVTRVQSATEWTASVHTLHMSKPNVTRVKSATESLSSSSSPRLAPHPAKIFFDVARHRETSIKFIDVVVVVVAQACAPLRQDFNRRRETSRDIDKFYRRRETSRDIDKFYRRRETSRDIDKF